MSGHVVMMAIMAVAWFSTQIRHFFDEAPEAIIGHLTEASDGAVEKPQINAWREEVAILKQALPKSAGWLHFEYPIPRLGGRIDAVAVFPTVIVVVEFKVGQRDYARAALDQVSDYALDLKNFHEPSHYPWIAPVLVATAAPPTSPIAVSMTPHHDRLLRPIGCTPHELSGVVDAVIAHSRRDGGSESLDVATWHHGRYYPTPTIVEAALARDRGEQLRKGVARSEVKAFVQNVHHYRDAYLADSRPPVDHVALFDEAQRAWDRGQTSKFMEQKRNRPGFDMSEPEFLISTIDRHQDWGVVVCLVGGGQEINTGEAGIAEWLGAVDRRFPHWRVHVSDRLVESEYRAEESLQRVLDRGLATFNRNLHLGVSMRSFRAEHVSQLVRELLDLDVSAVRATLRSVAPEYPIVITRDIDRARRWLREQARGSERYGVIASSHAERLKPYAIDVKTPVDPVHWFLSDKDDVRSSYYCEDVVTEFQIQGLELDWACATGNGNLRASGRCGRSHTRPRVVRHDLELPNYSGI